MQTVLYTVQVATKKSIKVAMSTLSKWKLPEKYK